ncbi:response regulator [Stappia sp. GBMRC 2046]|uniref:Response regulator n=1 Tax=Stappia sediminis TaxID=2692190 RepID=A0A7X3S778_9HYPH|nr:response regulator transcription factor [Stappia sediminis]MXN64528.1 response regulator [Stappia sediminis]
MQNKTILVVDDDPHIRDVICFALKKAFYPFETATDGQEAIRKVGECNPALIVLDVGLPEMDGLDVCRQIRKTSEVPILFLSARDDEVDRIIGLELGADDYVTKPFSPRELIARVGVILKRYGTRPPSNDPSEEPVLRHGSLELERTGRIVMVDGLRVSLTAIEFDILAIFLTRPKMVFTRGQILQGAYKNNVHVSDRTIDSHIRNVRGKLGTAGCFEAIETVHGVGFRLGACRSRTDQ